ncbi:AICAR transformylase/IMP cyclohydrolase PurH [Spirochaeta africana]|uniref:AICAR transformylase/IMP cyclohydrolase PurH n=1 Tax=Spirochaeta africana (strain ATCC 700263 / DSM 8902 / Z-7692) TaxID=889378 RepID=H9UJI2_SPIAZ|nr:AICAR transformylase/IMP cyclohydrolase PurH [Spirochaeta africana]AFG37675.1 AICAR transformylase/IMP cyclohydrolase PurH [Spirochaeta africana DSM 8902]
MNRVEVVDNNVPLRTALISVSDKTGLAELVVGLAETCPGMTVYSTGGTYRGIEQTITEHGLQDRLTLTQVSAYTGQPEMQGGLVKTLDFRIYLGLLSETYNAAHRQDLQRTGAEVFDLTVVNLYPFTAAAAAEGATLEDARANIDIGGPTMIRASAKNYLRVTAVCRPNDYPELLQQLRTNNGATRLDFRYRMARAAFTHTAEYDTAIAQHLQHTELDESLYRYGTTSGE